ncbi:MAG: hypothetical protein JWQ49_2787 [Edaphobacter sp.]|jgi:hypothetical protein|nr:hypothetical protein [Edaphobacter sp.]
MKKSRFSEEQIIGIEAARGRGEDGGVVRFDTVPAADSPCFGRLDSNTR